MIVSRHDLRRVRVGLLLDGPTVPHWMERMLRVLRHEPAIELVLALHYVPAKTVESGASDAEDRRSGWLWQAWRRADARRSGSSRAWCPVVAEAALRGVPIGMVQASRQADGDVLADDTVAALRNQRLDVLLQLHSGVAARPLRGAVLAAARCGVWSHGIGVDTGQPALPPAAREVVEGEAVTASWLRMTRAGSECPGAILDRAWTRTDPVSPARTLENLAWTQASFAPRRLRELAALGPEAFLARHDQAAEAAHAPPSPARPRSGNPFGNLPVAGALSGLVRNKLAERFQNLRSYEQWTLFYRYGAPASSSGSLPDSCRGYTALVPPRDRFWADPCAVHYRGQHALFLEECEYANEVGYLSVIPFDDSGRPVLPPRPILRRPGHLSYPFVFEDEGVLYMVPESAANRSISLYRCRRFPDEWEFVMHLAENLRAYDTTIWKHDGRYWMFATVCEHDEASSWDELFLFHSDALLSRNWTPHPCNPIVSDARRARPAGAIFEHEGRWYRPSQDCSRRYGGAIVLQRIDIIDAHRYAETPVGRIEPDRKAGMLGTHTTSRAGHLSCVDGVVRRWKLPLAGKRQLLLPPLPSDASRKVSGGMR